MKEIMNWKLMKTIIAVSTAFSLVGWSKNNQKEMSTIKATQFGYVKGVKNKKNVVWYGIPYAQSPTKKLRWQAPKSPKRWSKTLNCTQPKASAIQYVEDKKTGKISSKGTDDCLNLDVYSKPKAQKLPVIVYIHGGNNQSGNAQEIKGNEIVQRNNCVYVSLSYRLGLLGFNCLPSLINKQNKTGNFALLDIAKGLDWVKNNIRNFGGDPQNITVSGFSAGGRDVMAMLISPLFKGKFNKAIVYSGGMTTSTPQLAAKKIASILAPLAVADQKAKSLKDARKFLLSNSKKTRDYLYSISSARIASAVGNANIRMSAFPHLYADGVVLPKSGFKTTKYNDVPLLMLTGTTEFSFFNNFDQSYNKITDEETKNKSIAFGNKYGSDMYRIFNAEMSAEQMSKKYKSNIYIAEINYGSPTSPSKIPMFNSFHGIFVPMLADQNGYTSLYNFKVAKGYQNMAQIFNKYLAHFIRSGNPNGTRLTKWNKWTMKKKKSQVFDADASKAIIKSKNTSKSYKEIMKEMDDDTTLTSKQKKYVIDHALNGRWFSSALEKKYHTDNLWVK